MHYFIITGESSGDLYGSKIIQSLRKIDSDANFSCFGGEYMKVTGANVIRNLDKLSFMGFSEVVKNIATVFNNVCIAKKHINKTKPNAIILIDYPAFNMQIAKYSYQMGIPIYWVVAPKVWAWNYNRVYKLKKYVNSLFVIFPFELSLFTKHKIKTRYLGNPLIDIFHNKVKRNFVKPLGKSIIALLPGSRKQEIQNMLPLMLLASLEFPSYRFVVVCAKNINRSFYESFTDDYNSVELSYDNDMFNSVTAAVVTSGTATLELAILKIPQLVCYRLNFISFFLARLLVKIKHISLVNILGQREIVKELIQSQCTVDNIISEIKIILNKTNRNQMLKDYEQVANMLGKPGFFDNVSRSIHVDLSGINNVATK